MYSQHVCVWVQYVYMNDKKFKFGEVDTSRTVEPKRLESCSMGRSGSPPGHVSEFPNVPFNDLLGMLRALRSCLEVTITKTRGHSPNDSGIVRMDLSYRTAWICHQQTAIAPPLQERDELGPCILRYPPITLIPSWCSSYSEYICIWLIMIVNIYIYIYGIFKCCLLPAKESAVHRGVSVTHNNRIHQQQVALDLT